MVPYQRDGEKAFSTLQLDRQSPSLKCGGIEDASHPCTTPPQASLGNDSLNGLRTPPSKSLNSSDLIGFLTPEAMPINASYRTCRHNKQPSGIATRSVSSAADYYLLDKQTADRLVEIEAHVSQMINTLGIKDENSPEEESLLETMSSNGEPDVRLLRWRVLLSVTAILMSTLRLRVSPVVSSRISKIAISLALACLVARPSGFQLAVSSMVSMLFVVFATIDHVPNRVSIAISLSSYVATLDDL
eukprot:TRINITY_DN3742_c3_g1_i1.p1 TRINITY_DN3742_c3_g1~~TRINITY_DN3742_c3_g1_i1.p1  ORF type:complete len:264 (+),score=48.73 TRINITY_DN3742_c3_g1_i1:60-794(+)